MSLTFVGRLDDEGYYTSFGKRGWKINTGELVVVKGPKTEALCTLNEMIGKLDLVVVTKEVNSANL